ncbi:MAG TPA: lipoate--protein ligase family protein [Verrucomicrobiae bacterium]|jgi:lipoate-protein ligase A|nr:lipoate--protein ligase family protein [Verrucomicrobiae bacterium]
MHYLEITLPSPAANLACDEALLDACEEGSAPEVLRFWEPRECFVVAGFSNAVAREVNLEACRQAGVGVFRRCSGGGTVLQGPGCLNYSLALKLDGRPELDTIPGANCHIMARHRAALSALLNRPAEVRGFTDLAIGELKFSGNAQRRKRCALIFHGTFLLAFDFSLMENFLTMPSREPEYRRGRPHAHFLMNLNVPAQAVKTALRDAWSAAEELGNVPDCRRLVAEKYSRDDWNLKF